MPNSDNLIGKGFESKPENINRSGRPKKWQTDLIQGGYTKSQINECYATLLGQTEEELIAIRDNKDLDILIRKTAKALLKEWEKGTIYNQETMITRLHGQPKQEIDQTISITSFNISLNLNGDVPTNTDH